MAFKRPTHSQIQDIATSLGMTLSSEDISEYLTAMQGNFDAWDLVDALPDDLPEVKYPRTPGVQPQPEDNPFNAWYVKTDIKGADAGKLAGKTVVVKDNVCVAGVPLMNGAATLKGYTADMDATVVTRLLDEGATIKGKTNCEYFCMSGGSHTSALGPVHNPYKEGYSAGGSSSGSAALVAAGMIDMAIGGDQGGSVRLPASWSGCYGMKPTFGLVPYTGAMPIENTIDHLGPLTNTVADNALMLEVMAGYDGLDPRQYDVQTQPYTAALGKGVKGLKIGIVKEGFGLENSEADVDHCVRAAAEHFTSLGASVEEFSLPEHLTAFAVWTAISVEGASQQMMQGNGAGMNYKGLYVTSLIDAHSNWRSHADQLSDSLKLSMLTGEYVNKTYQGYYYGKAQNQMRRMTQAYTRALEKYDLLVMPTTAMKATPLPQSDAPRAEYIQRAFEMLANTAPFNSTGHPAMAIPCGLREGLPVSMMIVGKHFDEMTIYKAADAFEASTDWKML